MIRTLRYKFCHSDSDCIYRDVMCCIVHDIQALCYRFCHSDFVRLSVICYIVHDTDIVL